MTKHEMIKEIMDDMYRKNPGHEAEVKKRFSGFLERLPKTEVERIYGARFPFRQPERR